MSQEQQGRSRWIILTMILTIISIVVLIQNQEIGLTLFFVSILVLSAKFIYDRLQLLGAEAFALGSVFVWIGFFVAAFPLIAFAWNFLELSAQLILFFLGIFIIIFGYSLEYFDLNARFVKFIRNVRDDLIEVLNTLRERIFRSVWTFLAIIFVIAAVLAIFIPNLEALIPNLFGIRYGVSLEFLILAVVSMLIEFRSVVRIVVVSIARFLHLMLLAFWKRLRNLPAFLAKVYDLSKRLLINAFSFLGSTFSFLFHNMFVAGFAGALIFGYLGISRSDEIIQSIAIVLLLISLINFLQSQQDRVANGVARIQQSAYRRSFTLRNLITREHTGNCPSCQTPVSAGNKYCRECGTFIPDCLVCRNTIYAGEEVLTCSNCEHVGHADHLQRWLSIRPTCPNCRTEWS